MMETPANTKIDPLAQQVARFVVDFYLPRLTRFVRRNLSPKALGWVALAGVLVLIPFALAAAVRASGERTHNKRYDINDYLSDDLV